MAYNKFTTELAVEQFDLNIVAWENPHAGVVPVEPSDFLKSVLKEYMPLGLAIGTEKARSELIVMPILAEVRSQMNYQVSIFSGKRLNVDTSQGLTGVVDFLISKDPEQYSLKYPIITIVEAKKEDLEAGVGQCAAEMIAARMLNEKKGHKSDIIYGAVTAGDTWKFLKLNGNKLHNQLVPTTINEIDKILGFLIKIASE
jgi:hypothetical protein